MMILSKRIPVIVMFALLCTLLFSACSGQTIELLAEDADLSGANDIILEPNEPPYNLGGWMDGNLVAWDFTVEEEGFYDISILYARPYTSDDAWGTVLFYLPGESEPVDLEFRARSTSSDESDWSVYKSNDTMGIALKPGKHRMEIIPGGEEYPFYDPYFINLRSVTLTLSD